MHIHRLVACAFGVSLARFCCWVLHWHDFRAAAYLGKQFVTATSSFSFRDLGRSRILIGVRQAMAEAASIDRKDSSASLRKALVGNYSLGGLCITWDNREGIRQRIRSHSRLLLNYDTKLKKQIVATNVETSVHNLRANAFVLSPLLHLMRFNGQLLPNLDRLIAEIHGLYERYTKVSGDVVYHEAWALRHLISLLKSEHYKIKKEKRPLKDPSTPVELYLFMLVQTCKPTIIRAGSCHSRAPF